MGSSRVFGDRNFWSLHPDYPSPVYLNGPWNYKMFMSCQQLVALYSNPSVAIIYIGEPTKETTLISTLAYVGSCFLWYWSHRYHTSNSICFRLIGTLLSIQMQVYIHVETRHNFSDGAEADTSSRTLKQKDGFRHTVTSESPMNNMAFKQANTFEYHHATQMCSLAWCTADLRVYPYAYNILRVETDMFPPLRKTTHVILQELLPE